MASVDVNAQAIKVGNAPDEYEQMYGTPEHWPLRDLALGSWPAANRAFWTQGVLSVTGETFRLCVPDEALCIGLDRPAPEIRDLFLAAARSRGGQLTTITGALTSADPTLKGGPISGFMFWGVEWGAAPARRGSEDRAAVEDVVRDPGRFVGRRLTLEGCFRGDRWPDAEGSARPRGGQGWVLADGPFHIWVMGQPARGKGWSLGASDAGRGFVVEATGTVQRAGPGVYLDAHKVGLLKRNETRCP